MIAYDYGIVSGRITTLKNAMPTLSRFKAKLYHVGLNKLILKMEDNYIQ